ncbi:hypothetical protein [Streptomyces sp. NPDC015414]|uniref:hypothetical protein n=1 Tax=Streptomyces sp. NPDC015414 TaxID=3364957 RepID=UPI0037008153
MGGPGTAASGDGSPATGASWAFGHCVTGDSDDGRAEFTRERIGRLRPGRLRAGGPVTSRAGVERLAADSC